MEISSLARFIKGYKFLLTCINVFSKFAWVVPLENKTGKSLVNGSEIILDTGRSPEKLKTDNGTKFLNHNFQSFLKEKNFHFFTTNSELIIGKCGRTFQSHLENSYVKIFYCKEYPCLHRHFAGYRARV